jgi:hypothetical protein
MKQEGGKLKKGRDDEEKDETKDKYTNIKGKKERS